MKKNQKKTSIPGTSGQQSSGNTPESHYTLQRRGFLKTLGLLGGSTLLGQSALASGNITRVESGEIPFKSQQKKNKFQPPLGMSPARRQSPLDLSPAKWIWYPETRTLPCTFVHFRKEFVLSAGCLEGIGKIAADSRYRLYVNGHFVQRGPAPFDPRYQELDPVNITQYLQKGKNVIGIIVCYFGYGEGTYIPGYPGLLFDLKAKTEKDEINIFTDSTWRVLKSKSWKSGQYQ